MTEPKIISREDAKAAGLKRFFSGVPCSRGHVAERYVSTSGCRQCASEDSAQYRAENKASIAEWTARYQAKKKEAKRKARMMAEAALAASVPDPLPEEAVSRLLARAALRRKTATTTPAAAGEAAHAVQDVEATDPTAVLLRAAAELDRMFAQDPNLICEFKDDPSLIPAVAQATVLMALERERANPSPRVFKSKRKRPAARKPAPALPAAPIAPPEEPMLDLNNDHDRLQAIRNTITDLKAGRPFDHRQAECIRIWPALFRLVVEQPAVNRIELFQTCAARLARKIAGEERETDKPFGGRTPASQRRKRAAPPAARQPAPDDLVEDVI